MTTFPAGALCYLQCPHCGAPLAFVSAGVVGCCVGHRFDVAGHGYLPLLGPRSRTDTADTAAMVAAREAFLGGGWYAPIADAVADLAAGAQHLGGPVVEVGAGTGYYLAAATAALPAERRTSTDRPRGIALDSSKYALRRAARIPGIAAVLADAWAPLPVRTGCAAATVCVFAPRDPAELVRITAPGGRIVVVTPAPDHLAELRGPLGLLDVDAGKADRVAASVDAASPGMTTSLGSTPVRYVVDMPRTAMVDVAAMGPALRHTSIAAISEAAARLADPTPVTVAVTVTTLQRLAPAVP